MKSLEIMESVHRFKIIANSVFLMNEYHLVPGKNY